MAGLPLSEAMGMSMGNLMEFVRQKQDQRAEDYETFWKGVRLICWHIAVYAGKSLEEGYELTPSDIVELPSDQKKSKAKKYSEPELLTLIDEQLPQDV